METSATAAEQVNNIDSLLQQQSIYDANYDSDYVDYTDNCVDFNCVDYNDNCVDYNDNCVDNFN